MSHKNYKGGFGADEDLTKNYLPKGKSLLDRIPGKTQIKIFHGTSSKHLFSISKEGLRPGKPENKEAWGLSVTTRRSEAEQFAKEATENWGGNPIIIETKVSRGKLMVNKESLAAYDPEKERWISAARYKGGNISPNKLYIKSEPLMEIISQ